MADLATLQARLAEAETALHKLTLGGGVTEVWRDGRRIAYSKADPKALQDYIRDLKRQIADLTGERVDDPLFRRTHYTPRFG